MICAIGILTIIVLSIIFVILDKQYEYIMLSSLILILIIIIVVLTILGSGIYIINRIEYPSTISELKQTRVIYIDELNKYENMRYKDITSSLTYLILKEKIIEFNYQINRANQLNNILFDYVIINPAYRQVEPINLTVG